MKIYQIEAVVNYTEEENKVTRFFKKLFRLKPLQSIQYMNIFVYNNESIEDVVESVLLDRSYFPYIVDSIESIKKEEIKDINDVKVVLVPNFEHWIRYNRLLKYPDFNWDKYVTLKTPLCIKIGTEVRYLTPDSFINKELLSPEDGVVKRINFMVVPKKYDDQSLLIGRVYSDQGPMNIRYSVFDPIFFSEEEKEEFERN